MIHCAQVGNARFLRRMESLVRSFAIVALLAFGLMAAGQSGTAAQEDASIRGTVLDAAGHAVAGGTYTLSAQRANLHSKAVAADTASRDASKTVLILRGGEQSESRQGGIPRRNPNVQNAMRNGVLITLVYWIEAGNLFFSR